MRSIEWPLLIADWHVEALCARSMLRRWCAGNFIRIRGKTSRAIRERRVTFSVATMTGNYVLYTQC